MPTILTLSRHPKFYQQLTQTIRRHEGTAQGVVVIDGNWGLYRENTWRKVRGVDPFIYARNVNLGLKTIGEDDVLLINDDCELVMPLLAEMQRLVREHPQIGLLSPQIDGPTSNPAQRISDEHKVLALTAKRLAFVCIYIPWQTRQLVGELDEQFYGYGYEDDDYCIRVRQAGLQLAVATQLRVRHTHVSSSFLMQMSEVERSASEQQMKVLFHAKHAQDPLLS